MSAKNQHYCLKWNNYQAHVIELFEQFLEANCLVDVTISVENNTIHAHRIVLSACSTFFQEIFSGVEDSHPIVILSGMSYEDVKSVVEFIYRGELSVSADQVSAVLQVARELKVNGLMEVGSHVLELDIECNSTDAATVASPDVEEATIEPALSQELEVLNESEVVSEDVDFLIDESGEMINTEANYSTDAEVSAAQEDLLDQATLKINENVEIEKKKNRRKDTNKRNYNELAMSEALDDLRNGRSLLETSMTRQIPRSTLYFRARALGVALTYTRQEHSREKIHAAVQAVADGASLQKASKQFDIPKTVLWRHMQKEGNRCASVRKSGYGSNVENRQAAVRALESGENLSKVSAEFQISKGTLFREKTRLVKAGRLPWTCMPKRDSNSDTYKQRRLAEAVAACKNGKMSQATASITYRVPKTTIWRRMQCGMKTDALNSKEIVEQEEILIDNPEIPTEDSETLTAEPLLRQTDYTIVTVDNTEEIPVSYIDESDLANTALIILTTEEHQAVTLTDHGRQIIVDTDGDQVLEQHERQETVQ